MFGPVSASNLTSESWVGMELFMRKVVGVYNDFWCTCGPFPALYAGKWTQTMWVVCCMANFAVKLTYLDFSAANLMYTIWQFA